ncbi:MAG TPA: pyrroline-5-carboxylate reductase [Opitutaceae bacterium]|nr:pyrroline-5-carboxylate reductase [Opitutaceae bacterium]
MAKLAFIGAGRMASAIVDGLLAKKAFLASEIACYTASGTSAAQLAQRTGIRKAENLDALLTEADVVVVAFKPQHLAGADARLADLTAGKLVISVLAAKTLSRLHRTFPKARNVIRTMPNTPAAIGAGVTGWCAHQPLLPTDRSTLSALLGAIGLEIEVPETQIDALMAISGCGPAFVFEFTAALREAGVAAGLERDRAEKLAVYTMLGSARLMAETQSEPEALRNQVTSPNGTTFAGLQRLAARDFRGMILETVLASKARSEELSRDT